MNDDTSPPPDIKTEADEVNKASTESSSSSVATMKSPPFLSHAKLTIGTSGSTKSIPGRSSAAPLSSLDVLPDSSRAASNASTSDVSSSVKSPSADRPSLSHSAARNSLASLPSAKRKRLPQDKVGQLEDRIALDARDADAWLALIGEHQAKGKISDARNTYERFLKVFPDLVRIHLKLLN